MIPASEVRAWMQHTHLDHVGKTIGATTEVVASATVERLRANVCVQRYNPYTTRSDAADVRFTRARQSHSAPPTGPVGAARVGGGEAPDAGVTPAGRAQLVFVAAAVMHACWQAIVHNEAALGDGRGASCWS